MLQSGSKLPRVGATRKKKKEIDALMEGCKAPPVIREANGGIWESYGGNRVHYCLLEYGAVWKRHVSPKFCHFFV
jgi:hypothetical protein